MAIREHPPIGTLLMCDFDQGFREPEMIKRRLVAVISPKIADRFGLCTVVSLSTSVPDPVMAYHCQIDVRPRLPDHYISDGVWVKGDMIYSVGFHRLDFVRLPKGPGGQRNYYTLPLSGENVNKIRKCVLSSIGLLNLTKHLP